MTPFGAALRKMRDERNVNQAEMAQAIGVSPAYLSALEHGRRGQPSWELLQRIIVYFNIIWDEAEELERLANQSHPKVSIDTSGMPPDATILTNLLKREIRHLEQVEIQAILDVLKTAASRRRS